MKTRSRSSARIAAHKLLSPAKQACSASADGRKGFVTVSPIPDVTIFQSSLAAEKTHGALTDTPS